MVEKSENNTETLQRAISQKLEKQLKYRAGKLAEDSGNSSESLPPEDKSKNAACEFIDEAIARFTRENEKAIRNRNLYYRCEWSVLFLTAVATALNVIGAYNKDDFVAAVVGSIGAIATASVTAIIGYRSIKGYLETWLRHRDYVQKFQGLCLRYAFGCSGYEYFEGCCVLRRDSPEAKKHECDKYNEFKDSVCEILRDRHSKFRENMSRRGPA